MSKELIQKELAVYQTQRGPDDPEILLTQDSLLIREEFSFRLIWKLWLFPATWICIGLFVRHPFIQKFFLTLGCLCVLAFFWLSRKPNEPERRGEIHFQKKQITIERSSKEILTFSFSEIRRLFFHRILAGRRSSFLLWKLETQDYQVVTITSFAGTKDHLRLAETMVKHIASAMHLPMDEDHQ